MTRTGFRNQPTIGHSRNKWEVETQDKAFQDFESKKSVTFPVGQRSMFRVPIPAQKALAN